MTIFLRRIVLAAGLAVASPSFKNAFAQTDSMGPRLADPQQEAQKAFDLLTEYFSNPATRATTGPAFVEAMKAMKGTPIAQKFKELKESEHPIAVVYREYLSSKAPKQSYENLLNAITEVQQALADGKTKAVVGKYGKSFVTTVESATIHYGLPVKVDFSDPDRVLLQFLDARKLRPIVDQFLSAEEKHRIEFLQRMYNELLLQDGNFENWVMAQKEPEEDVRQIRVTGKSDEPTKKAMAYLGAYLVEHAQGRDDAAVAYRQALAEAGIRPEDILKSKKEKNIPFARDYTYHAVVLAEVVSEPRFMRALAIYWMLETPVKATWDEEKGAFLGKTRGAAPGITAAGAREAVPVPVAKRVISLDTQLADLQRQRDWRGSRDEELFNDDIKAWLEGNVKGREAAYEMYEDGLRGLIAHVSQGQREGATINEGWLDEQLEGGHLKEFMDKKLTFHPEQVARLLFNGNDIAQCLRTLEVEENPVGPKTDMDDRIEAARVRVVQLLLGHMVSESWFADIRGPLAAVTPDGPYEDRIEGAAMKAVQDFLFGRANHPEFSKVLETLGIKREDIKSNGQFDSTTARALLGYLSYKKGTWWKEKKPFQELTPDIAF